MRMSRRGSITVWLSRSARSGSARRRPSRWRSRARDLRATSTLRKVLGETRQRIEIAVVEAMHDARYAVWIDRADAARCRAASRRGRAISCRARSGAAARDRGERAAISAGSRHAWRRSTIGGSDRCARESARSMARAAHRPGARRAPSPRGSGDPAPKPDPRRSRDSAPRCSIIAIGPTARRVARDRRVDLGRARARLRARGRASTREPERLSGIGRHRLRDLGYRSRRARGRRVPVRRHRGRGHRRELKAIERARATRRAPSIRGGGRSSSTVRGRDRGVRARREQRSACAALGALREA